MKINGHRHGDVTVILCTLFFYPPSCLSRTLSALWFLSASSPVVSLGFFTRVPLATFQSACRYLGSVMEFWPTLAQILLMSNLADRLQMVQMRDFSMKDIIQLHPSRFKCFTCQDAADNYECNRWAPDVYCPQDSRYCYTTHVMDRHGNSISVTKRCVTPEACLLTGCADVHDGGHQVCSSCCQGNICNVSLPRNHSVALFSSTSPLASGAAAQHHAQTPSDVIIICVLALGCR
ncbi:ly6/PLAUR domain-containing protein 6-like isoform X2 [Nerophis lumbriciformis]|uniref:ly6/PLAUR domain-containing protein 6-like isoform X2 n=1 Tax=Nerophis lumbriciformis TaxID=546530 RepID=UPI002ADF5B4B|nr:ly6/PLAUR domain-containing protein 6-like isoform X2 [Nerophis lumbriciformis]